MSTDNNGDDFSIQKLIPLLNRKPDVLCVEDNEISALLITDILKDYCTVFHVESGENAIKIVENRIFDLILMDIGLGKGINGIETSREIHKVKGFEAIPVAAVTGFLDSYKKTEFLEAGIDYFLAKPFTKSELLNLTQEILIKCIYSAPESYPETPIGAP